MKNNIFIKLLYFIFVLSLPSLNTATACSVPEEKIVHYYIKQLSSKNAFYTADVIKRIAYRGKSASIAIPSLKKLASQKKNALRYLALWGIVKIDKDNTFARNYIEEAIAQKKSINIYNITAAVAFLAQVEEANTTQIISQFLPSLYSAMRNEKSFSRKSAIAWALYEINTKITIEQADLIVGDFIADLSDDNDHLFNGINAITSIGPRAHIAVPTLIALSKGELDIHNIVYKEDAAMALATIGNTEAKATFDDFIKETLNNLNERPKKPSLIDHAIAALVSVITGVDAKPNPHILLEASLNDLNQLLPYSFCTQKEVETIFNTDNFPPTVYLESGQFLLAADSELKPIIRQRLMQIKKNVKEESLKKRSLELLNDY